MGMFKFFKNQKLGLKLNLVLVLVLGLFLAISLVIINNSIANLTVQIGRQRALQEVAVIQRRFNEAEEEILAAVKQLAATSELVEAVAERKGSSARIIASLGAIPLDLDLIEVVDVDGESLVSLPRTDTSSDRAAMDDLLSLGLSGIKTTGFIPEQSGEKTFFLVAVVPLQDRFGAVVGSLLVGRRVDDAFLAEINFNREDVHLVLFRDGQLAVLSSIHSTEEQAQRGQGTDSEKGGREFIDIVPDEATVAAVSSGEPVIVDNLVYSTRDDPHVLVYSLFTAGDDVGAVAGIMVPLNKLFVIQRQVITSLSVVFVFLVLTAIFIVSQFARRSITTPIGAVMAVAERISQGELEVDIPSAGGDEIGQLSDRIATMAGRLQQTAEEQAQYTQRLEVAALLSERLGAILNLEDLLAEVVNQVQDHFGYYHAHIYLLDDKQEKLVVAEGTGPAGAQMKAAGHNIPLAAPTSLVARAARSGEIITISNVKEAPDWLPNELLPDTRSEMAVPIILEGEVVGVLDVQEDEIGGFDAGDTNLLRSLTGQIAVAIRNAQYVADVETALAQARETQEQYTQQAWDRTRISQQTGGQAKYNQEASAPLSEAVVSKAREQLQEHDRPTTVSLSANGPAQPARFDPTAGTEPGQMDDNQERNALIAPITLGDITIGNLQLYSKDPNRVWTEGELALIQTVTGQVAQAAEGLRLLSVTQERASREQLIAQITDKIRHAPNLEALMKVGVSELARVLNVDRTFIRFGDAEELAANVAPLTDDMDDNEQIDRELVEGKSNQS